MQAEQKQVNAGTVKKDGAQKMLGKGKSIDAKSTSADDDDVYPKISHRTDGRCPWEFDLEKGEILECASSK